MYFHSRSSAGSTRPNIGLVPFRMAYYAHNVTKDVVLQMNILANAFIAYYIPWRVQSQCKRVIATVTKIVLKLEEKDFRIVYTLCTRVLLLYLVQPIKNA